MLRIDRIVRIFGRAGSLAGILVLAGLVAGLLPATASSRDIDLTIDGVAFAASRGEVRNERMIEISGSSIVLATWDEQRDSGEFAPHFGVSLDGQELVRVAEASYELGLRYAHFDPLLGVPDIAPELTADTQNRLFLVQFFTQPLEIFNQQIAERGGLVRQYVAQFAYLVEMDPAAQEEIAALPYVRWIGAYHPAYRLEEFAVHNLDRAAELYPLLRYNIQVHTVDQKLTLANRVAALGGVVLKADAGKHLIVAELTPEQLLGTARLDEVNFIDRYGDYEEDMNIARQIGGADYILGAAGYDGTGVRGSIFDSGFNLSHIDFAHHPLIIHTGAGSAQTHGAATSGINFGDGTGDPTATGMMPNGQGIVTSYNAVSMTGPSRYNHTGQLVGPPYEAVFQTSSVGSPRTSLYTTISAGSDEMIFDFDISLCQSQSNAGTQQSRPQAWAKNMISGGGLNHYGTLSKADDCWCHTASIGPASDGRIKPTFTHFYDRIRTTYCCGSTSYTSNFGGTSGATPIICGHVGLFYGMWADGIFGNPVNPGGTVFENRSHMTTAKAMLVNTAEQYDFVGLGHDKARNHQGWGMPNLGTLYDLRDRIFIVDETDILTNFETAFYRVNVPIDEGAFNVTMTYADPPGNPAVQSQHRVNDLDLRVTSPAGLVYHGNVGLLDTPWSVTGGTPDDKNTVECVFVAQPESGVWLIEVTATEVIQDGHVETGAMDVDFALVASPIAGQTTAIDSQDAAPVGLKMAILGMGPGIAAAQISFELADATPVRLRLFDVQGRMVATLHDGMLVAGDHTLSWDGIDIAGEHVGAGVYFARLEAGERTATGKVLVIR